MSCKIIALDSDESIAPYRGPLTKVIDAKGNMALPGFVESHVHVMAGAGMIDRISLNDAKTITDFQRMIMDFADAHPEKEWIQGMGWYYSIFGKSGLPDKKYIDEVVSETFSEWRTGSSDQSHPLCQFPESNTAAMLEPYSDDPANKGFMYIDSEQYMKSVAELDRLGFTISTHAIGDATVRLALDAYEAANKANGTTDTRHRIESRQPVFRSRVLRDRFIHTLWWHATKVAM